MDENKTILVVDDVAMIRASVRAALRDLPVQLVEASGGQQALEIQNAKPADLILCDVNMPEVGGEAVLRALRERGDNTPVIMLTAEGDKAVVAELIGLGVQGYLLKPFKPTVLAARVRDLLGCESVRPAAPPEAADLTSRKEA